MSWPAATTVFFWGSAELRVAAVKSGGGQHQEGPVLLRPLFGTYLGADQVRVAVGEVAV